MTLNTIELYGGAITTVIPDGFLDVSMLREVPDTQEVYVNGRDPHSSVSNDGLGYNESIIIDLLQRVDVEDDRMALDFHLKEIGELNGSNDWRVIKYDNQFDTLLTKDAVPQTCILLETVSKWGKVNEPPQAVVSCIGLLRLKDVTTDVLITVNVPLDPQQYPDENLTTPSQSLQNNNNNVSIPTRVSVAYHILQEIVKNFKVRDRSLFA